MRRPAKHALSLVLGLALGLGGGWLAGLKKHARWRVAREAQVRADREEGARIGREVSPLGQNAANPLQQIIATVLERRRLALAQDAKSLSPEARLARVKELLKSTNLAGFQWNEGQYYALRQEIMAYVLPEDLALFWPLQDQPNPELGSIQKHFLSYIAWETAATLPLEEVLAMRDADTDEGARASVLGAMLSQAALRDPFQALELLTRTEFQTIMSPWGGEMSAFYTEAARRDRGRAMLMAEELPNLKLRAFAISGVLQAVAESDGVAAALRASERITQDGLRHQAQIQLIEGMGQRSPKGRMEVLDFLIDPKTNPILRKDAIGDILDSWGSKEPAATLAWLDANAELLRNERSNFQKGLMAKWAAKDLEAALQSVQVQTGETRNQRIKGIFEGLDDPPKALAIIEKLPQADRVVALQTVASGWSMRAPSEAAAYIAALPAEVPEARGMTAELIENWVPVDAQAASEWLDKQPPGPAKSSGIHKLVMEVQQSDPAAAIAWTLQIPDEKARKLTQDVFFSNWEGAGYSKASEVRAWIEQNRAVLGEEQASSLLHRIPSPK